MKSFIGRQRSISWILICIFGCLGTDGKALICNRHEREHSRTLDENGRTTGQYNIEAVPYEYNIIEHTNHKDGQNKEYQSYINSFNTKDDKYNYITNSEEVIPKLHDITTIYLAGYDDQIINLMNDIQKHGTGCEVLVYFYLCTNNYFQNIGNFYTNKNILRDCIKRYNHYFCVGHNSNDCSCLSNVKSNNKQIMQINPEVKNEKLNKIDHRGNTSGQEFNIKADSDNIRNINDTISEFKVYYPEKQSTGSYEFILPKVKDVKFKDVFVDIVPKPSEVLVENKMVQNLDNNDAVLKVEIANNIDSGNNFASSLPKLDQQNTSYNLQGIADAAVNVDSITTSITTNNLVNVDYINGITDHKHTLAYDVPNINLPDTETSSVLQLKPGTYKDQVNIPVTSNQNVQLLDSSINIIPDVQKNPDLEPQNMIIQKPNSLPINIVPIDQTNEPKISNYEYVTYSQNIPEQASKNMNSINEVVGNGYGVGQSNRAIKNYPDSEYANDIKEAVREKLNDQNILMNPIQTNKSIEVNYVMPEIDLKTNTMQILNGNSNFITIDRNPNQNQSIDDIVVFSSSTPTFSKIGIEQGSLISDTITTQVIKDIDRTLTVESGTIKNKKNDIPSYVDYINSRLHEPNSPLVVNEEDKNNQPQLVAKENVNTQSPYYSNINSLVNSNHYNIPTFSTNRKEMPHSYVHNLNNYECHVKTPYNYMDYQLIQKKPQHHHHRWHFLQNGDVLDQNQSRFQSLDQPHKFNVPEQRPYLFSQPISGVIYGQGNEQCNHGLTKPNINQNENLYTTDRVKYMLNPNILKPLLSNHKNIVKNLEPVTGLKTENILDLSQINIDDKYNQRNPQEVFTTLFREKRPPKNLSRRKNYDDCIINLPDKGKEYPENGVDSNNNPLEYFDISCPIIFLPHNPYTGKHFNGFYPNVGSDVYHMLDPCTYKNILTLEGHGNPTGETPSTLANLRQSAYKEDTLLVDYKTNSQAHSIGGFFPTYDHFRLPASIPPKLNINASPINPYLSTYLSNFSQIENKLSPLIREIDLSNKDNISNFKKPTVPMLTIDTDVPRTEKSRTLTINAIENNVLQKYNLIEPIIKYINKIPQVLDCIGQIPKSILLNKLGLRASPLVYQPYLNQKQLVTNNPFRIPSHSHYLLPSKSKGIKVFLQPEKMSYIGPYQYSTIIAPKTQPLAHDVTVTGLPNDDNSIPMIYNNALLPNVSPTVFNPYHQNGESSPKIVTPITTHYPLASIPLKYIIPPIDTTSVSHADLFTNSISPCSTPGLIEENPYTSQAQHVPKLLPFKGESSTPNTQSSTADSKNSLNLELFTPILPFKASSDYVTLPLTSIIPDLHPSKIPAYIASPQNVVTFVNKSPSGSSSALELSNWMPSIKTQGTKSFSDTGNYPNYSHTLPVNADLSSYIQSQNTISFVPNSYKMYTNTLYGDQYLTSKPSTNISKPQKYSEFLPTISSIEKSRSFKSNLNTKHKHQNLSSFTKPDTLPGQEFQKYLTPIQNLENLSPDLVSSTNDKMPISHYTTDLKPLVFSPNYSLAPRFTNGNIVPWKLSNYDILQKTQSRSKTVSPRVDKANVLPVQGNAESVPLAMSETQNFNPSKLNPSLFTKHNPHNSVQPCQYLDNFGPSQNKLTLMPPCKSRNDAYQQVNVINNNFANIDQIPAFKPGFRSKEFPFRYAGYGLPTEIPKYGQCSQVNYLEPKPINKLANIDSLIEVTKLDLQPTTPTISTLGLQGLTIPAPLCNYVLPSLFLGSEIPKSAPFHSFIPSSSTYLLNEVSSTPTSLNKMTYPFATSNTVIPKINFVPQPTKIPLDNSSLAYQTYPSVSINDYINIDEPNCNFYNLQGSQPTILTLPNTKTSNISPKTTTIWGNLRKNRKFISSNPTYVSFPQPQQSIHALPVSSSLSMKVPYQSALDYPPGSAISLPSPSICSISGPLLWKTLAPYINKPDLTHNANTLSSSSTTSIPHTHIPTLAEKILDEAQLKPNNKHTRNKTPEKAYDGNIEQSNIKIINQMNNNIKDYIEKSDVKNSVLNEKLIEIPMNKYIGVLQYEPTNCKVSYLKTENPDIHLKVWSTAVKIVKPKVVLEIGRLKALNFCPVVKDKNIPYTNDEIQKVVELFVKKHYGEPIIVTNSLMPHFVADNIDDSFIKNGKAYIVWANVCNCGCNRMGCHCNNNGNTNLG